MVSTNPGLECKLPSEDILKIHKEMKLGGNKSHETRENLKLE
jgi:hypothetical protein